MIVTGNARCDPRVYSGRAVVEGMPNSWIGKTNPKPSPSFGEGGRGVWIRGSEKFFAKFFSETPMREFVMRAYNRNASDLESRI